MQLRRAAQVVLSVIVVIAMFQTLVSLALGGQGGSDPPPSAPTDATPAPPSDGTPAPPSDVTPTPPGDVQSSSDVAPAGLRLSCTGTTLPMARPGQEGMLLECSVSGAELDETEFRLSATLTGSTGETKTIDPLCIGELRAGAGSCTRNVIESVRYWGGGVVVSGVVLPSGRALAPLAFRPTP